MHVDDLIGGGEDVNEQTLAGASPGTWNIVCKFKMLSMSLKFGHWDFGEQLKFLSCSIFNPWKTRHVEIHVDKYVKSICFAISAIGVG